MNRQVVRLNTCQKCIKEDGGCCTDVEITLHESEARAFLLRKNKGDMPKGHKFKQDYVDKELWEYNSNGGPCMFLNEENSCGIYEERPSICRTYPVMWTKKRFKMNYFVDVWCPLTESVPVKEMSNWIDNLPNIKILGKIGELDFNTRSKDYVNLTVISSKVSSETETIMPYIKSKRRLSWKL